MYGIEKNADVFFYKYFLNRKGLYCPPMHVYGHCEIFFQLFLP